MKTRYCLPIIKSDKKEILGIIQKNINNFFYFEVWMDYIDELDLKFIEQLNKKLGQRLVLLFRRQNLETPKMSWDKKVGIMNFLDKSSVLLDLDVFNQTEEIKFLNKNSRKINKILSYHNYKETPELEQLKKIIKTMSDNRADIYKIATFCQKERDAVILLDLLVSLNEQGLKHIILGMGEHGAITRVFGTKWGNEMIFAPLTLKEKSAPGQLTKKQLEDIFEILES